MKFKTILCLFSVFIFPLKLSAVEHSPFNFGSYIELKQNIYLAPPVRPNGPPFDSVVAKYGPAIIKEGFFKAKSLIQPWSSYWFPKKNKNFWDETNGPGTSILGRYDDYVVSLGKPNPMARSYEESKIYSPDALPWEGLCDAWSMASIMESEPKREVFLQGIKFRIQDLKGLLIKTYENSFIKESFGQRNNAHWDSIHEDIFPEQFHRFIQIEMFEKNLAFLMDIDPGYQIWNVPVFKVETSITKDKIDPNIFHVRTWAHYASPFVKNLDFIGTHKMIKTYNYQLHTKKDENGNQVVEYGIWIENSRWDHPDFVVAKPDYLERKLNNKNLDLTIIDEILSNSR